MFNELTQDDIDKMQKEIDYRIEVLRPKISQEIVEAKAHGDLSENAEYHSARKEKGKNEGRIEYLRAMIKTSKIIKINTNDNEVGIFDKVEVFFEEEGTTEVMQLATTMQNDVSQNIVSKESPFGKAIMGKHIGDRVEVRVSPDYTYHVVIKSITKATSGVDLKLS